MAARQEADSEGVDIDAFLAHEHVALSPLLFEVSEPDPLLSVPPRQLPAEDLELAALIDHCPKDDNTRRAVALLEGLA